jgi:hypothetical protein
VFSGPFIKTNWAMSSCFSQIMILSTDWEDGKALKDFDDDNNSS